MYEKSVSWGYCDVEMNYCAMDCCATAAKATPYHF